MIYVSYSLRTNQPMRSPKRPFMVNDIVRLNRGWTPMTISWISPTGQVTAHYGIQDFHPDGEQAPDCPTSCYTRHHSGFSWWDGEFIPGKKQIDHRCNNRLCVNKDHLQMVTHRKNQQLRTARTKEKTHATISPDIRILRGDDGALDAPC